MGRGGFRLDSGLDLNRLWVDYGRGPGYLIVNYSGLFLVDSGMILGC